MQDGVRLMWEGPDVLDGIDVLYDVTIGNHTNSSDTNHLIISDGDPVVIDCVLTAIYLRAKAGSLVSDPLCSEYIIIAGKINITLLLYIIFLVSSNLNTSDTPWTNNSWYFGTNVIFHVSSCVYVEKGRVYIILWVGVCVSWKGHSTLIQWNLDITNLESMQNHLLYPVICHIRPHYYALYYEWKL